MKKWVGTCPLCPPSSDTPVYSSICTFLNMLIPRVIKRKQFDPVYICTHVQKVVLTYDFLPTISPANISFWFLFGGCA